MEPRAPGVSEDPAGFGSAVPTTAPRHRGALDAALPEAGAMDPTPKENAAQSFCWRNCPGSSWFYNLPLFLLGVTKRQSAGG